MIAVSKNVYIDTLVETVDNYNKTYRTIKMKPTDVKVDTYIDSGVENNEKDPKVEIDDHVRMSKCKMFLQRVTLQIGLRRS